MIGDQAPKGNRVGRGQFIPADKSDPPAATAHKKTAALPSARQSEFTTHSQVVLRPAPIKPANTAALPVAAFETTYSLSRTPWRPPGPQAGANRLLYPR